MESQSATLTQWTLLVPALVSWAICAGGLPVYIKLLKQHQIQQYLREEGPKSHAHKAKTPTAGGIGFWVSTVITIIGVYVYRHYISGPVVVVLLVASICGLLGVADDMAKVLQKSNKGVSEKLRLIVETATGFALGFIVVFGDRLSLWLSHTLKCRIFPGFSNYDLIPFWNSMVATLQSSDPMLSQVVPAAIIVLLSTFLIPATSNAFNLHDGMDGLSGGTSAMVLLTLAAVLLYTGQLDLAILCATVAGGVLAFLLYNRYPAKVFMGDTGSLFIGGLLGAVCAVGGVVLWFVPLTVIYIAEALSVFAQVGYFKLTKPYTPAVPISKFKLIVTKLTTRLPGEGKRLFRMAPLHHHFEAVLAEKGKREWEVVAMFWLAQLAICFFVLSAFFFSRPLLPGVTH